MLGFSLALSPSGSWFIGNLHNAGLRNVLTDELREGRVPPLLLYAHHNMVACARYGSLRIRCPPSNLLQCRAGDYRNSRKGQALALLHICSSLDYSGVRAYRLLDVEPSWMAQ